MALNLSQLHIEYVMDVCSCSRKEAIDLLKRSNNDPEQAYQRYQMKLQFGWTPTAASPPRSKPEDTSDKTNRKGERRKSEQTIENNLDGDGYDIIDSQSDQEVVAQRTKLSSSKNMPPGGHRASYEDLGHNDNSRQPNQRSGNLNNVDPKEVRFPTPDSRTSVYDHDSIPPPITDSSSQDVPKVGFESTVLSSETVHNKPPSDTDEFRILESKDDVNTQDLPQLELNSEPEPEPEPSKIEWDFVLPNVASGTAGSGPGAQSLSAQDLVALVQSNFDGRAVEAYFEYHDKRSVLSYINQEVEGFPTIFYAAATNNDRILRTWIEHGADVNAVHQASGIPVLAFAIVHSEAIKEDTTDIVATLLSLGASARAIPEPFYRPYDHDLPETGPTEEDLESCDQGQTVWLHPTTKQRLTQNLNLTHRYNLERALRTPKPSARHRQIAERYKAEGLLGLPYFLIGQSLAANRLLQTFINHLASRSSRPKPLVIVFAGPSGHGKTELARKLGYLMSLELEVVDCTIVNREIELFGGRHPYVNAAEGTPLNNFLAKNSEKRCIVFMDEFEKTTREIHQALLLPFDHGEYQDRRNLAKVDCSKTIWILATNALDARIRDFCRVNEAILFNDEDEENRKRVMKNLDRDLKTDFLGKFDAPITGRISAFLPFLLFSRSEQAVIAHKYLLELGRDVQRPVNLVPGPDERWIGNVRLHIKRDAKVCSHLAADGYHPDLGARSLITSVENIRHMLVDAYLGVDEAIRETQDLVDVVVDVRGSNIFVEMAH